LVIDLLTMTFDEIKMRQDINSANGEHAGVLALCNQQVT
jgi:hypothetical protein